MMWIEDGSSSTATNGVSDPSFLETKNCGRGNICFLSDIGVDWAVAGDDEVACSAFLSMARFSDTMIQRYDISRLAY